MRHGRTARALPVSCRCGSGRRTRMLYVPAELAEQVRQGVGTNAEVQAALAEISAINLELLQRGQLS